MRSTACVDQVVKAGCREQALHHHMVASGFV